MDLYIVSRGRLFCDMIAACLDQGNIHVTGRYSHVRDLPETTAATVVVLHSLPQLAEIRQQLAHLYERMPQAQVVLMPPIELCAVLQESPSPVAAVIPVDHSAETLIGTVLVVQTRHHRPEAVSPPAPSRAMVPKPAMQPPRERLSEREQMIMRCLMRGLSNKDIARDLGIQESTVKVHLRTCFRKIGVLNRTQAALWATLNLEG